MKRKKEPHLSRDGKKKSAKIFHKSLADLT